MFKKKYDLPILIIFGILILFIFSKNSWLYTTNDSADINSFMTMGNAWIHGKLPFKDIYEQKGPITYLVYAIAIKSGLWFRGIWILEAISLSSSLYILSKIFKLLETDRITSISAYLIYILASVSGPLSDKGGGVEELSLAFVTYSIYLLVKFDKKIEITTNEYIFAAIGFSIMFWVKYTMTLSYIIMVAALYSYWFIKRDGKKIIKNLTIQVTVFAIISAVIIGYFALNNGVEALFKVYFIDNITIYDLPFGKGIHRITEKINKLSASFPFILIPVIGAIQSLRKQHLNKYTIGLIWLLVLLNYFLFHLWYYALILLPVVVVMYAASDKKWYINLIFVAAIAGFTITKSPKIDQNRFTNYQSVGQRIMKVTHGSGDVVQLGMLDTGIFNLTDTTPHTKYFHLNNIPISLLPDLINDPVNQLKTHHTKYAIICDAKPIKGPSYETSYKGYTRIAKLNAYRNDKPTYFIILERTKDIKS